MKKTILLCTILALTGCSNISPKTQPSTAEVETKEELQSFFDNEAAELGFPEKFISKEREDIDWSLASADRLDDMNVDIYDTGVVVEVCGGLGCDR